MDYAEMQFAVSVRNLAADMRADERAQWISRVSRETAKASTPKWDEANPVMKFVPDAISQLQEIAALVRQASE